MEFEEFNKSLDSIQPPVNLNNYALALWYDAKGDWEQAHIIVQDLQDVMAARIHAYLHRKEGDNGNAGYWYRQAGTKMPDTSLQEEWKTIAKTVLRDAPV